MNIDKTVQSLQSKGYVVSVLPDGEAACKMIPVEDLEAAKHGMYAV